MYVVSRGHVLGWCHVHGESGSHIGAVAEITIRCMFFGSTIHFLPLSVYPALIVCSNSCKT